VNPLRQTEQAILIEGREWTRRRLQDQLQRDADALPTLCPQSGVALTNTRRRDLQLDTVAGRVELRVSVGWSESLGRWVNPLRQAWGLEPTNGPALNSKPAWLTRPSKCPPTSGPPRWLRPGARP